MMNRLEKPVALYGEKAVETLSDLGGPLQCRLPGHRAIYYVHGVARRRNYEGGPVLTLAIAQWRREGYDRLHTLRDPVSLMQLADLCSHHHTQPLNLDRYYGPRGRRSAVGRLDAHTARFDAGDCASMLKSEWAEFTA